MTQTAPTLAMAPTPTADEDLVKRAKVAWMYTTDPLVS